MTLINDLSALKSFVKVSHNSDFPIQNLPYGIFSDPRNPTPRVGVAIGDWILDLAAIAEAGLFSSVHTDAPVWFKTNTLNILMSQGPALWKAVRERLLLILSEDCALLRDNHTLRETALIPQYSATMYLPFHAHDYTDFYAGIHHAENVGRLIRDKDNPLFPSYRHVPLGYHGRASSLVISGTPIKRPCGQTLPAGEETPHFGPSQRLDFELELGAVIGMGNHLGEPISIDNAHQHIFGFVLVNDWSARDIQFWEYVPLGPFLGKSFATTVSPWVITCEALEPFKAPKPKQLPKPLPYLLTEYDTAYDIHLQVSITTEKCDHQQVISRTNAQALYWTQAQMIAHHTSNGCNLQVGDLLASGTISGSTPDSLGCLLEMTAGGKVPLQLAEHEERRFLEDGDSIIMEAWCEKPNYPRIGFGSAVGCIQPAIQIEERHHG